MYVIANINGLQTKIEPDVLLEVPRIEGQPGQELSFEEVLMVCDGERIAIGQPHVKGAIVTAELVEHLRGAKLRVFKFKRRRDYRRRRGHRDALTRIRVTGIKV